MPDTSRERHPDLGPYRTPESPGAARKKAPVWLIVTVAGLGLLCLYYILASGGSERPSIEEIPKDLLSRLERFPPPEAALRVATPLRPLLVADQPDALAVLGPREGATRLRRGERLRVRFNRPMVEGRLVGRDVEDLPLRFEPPIPGRAEWTSRSTLTYFPAPEAWSTEVRESRLVFEGDVTSLDGETLTDTRERVIVLDGAARVERSRSQGRVNAGAPLPLYFDAPVDARTLGSELLAYEIGGGQRSLPISVNARGEDARGDFRVDVELRKNLEPGARIGLAITPRYLDWGSRPGIFEYEITPPPSIEGIDCPEDAYTASMCAYNESPGRIIDIGPELRLLSSVPLEEPDASKVRVTPPLAKMRVSLATEGYSKNRRLRITGEWEPDQTYEVRVGALRTASGDVLRPTPPLAVRSRGHSPMINVDTGRLSFESGAEPRLRFAAINVEKAQVMYRAVDPGEELEAALYPRTFIRTADQVHALRPLAPTARPNRWGPGEYRWRDDAERTARMAVVGFIPSAESSPTAAQTSFVQATDLGVTLRASRDDLLIWVTSMTSGEPVEGAAVRVFNTDRGQVAQGTTDGDGVVVLAVSAAGDRGHVVLVTRGEDRALLMLDPRRAVAPYGLGIAPGAQAPPADLPVAAVFADRGAYRPGESLHAKVTVRDVHDDSATPVQGDFVVKLFSPSDTAPVAEGRISTGRWGTGAIDFDIPGGAPLGEYSLQVYPAEGEVSIGETSIRVSHFRQPTFRVDLETPAERLYEGDTLRFATTASFLFGAPVGGGEYEWSVVRHRAAGHATRWREYRFAAADAAAPSGTMASGDGRLDAQGRAEMEARISLGVPRRSEVLVEAEVTDSAGVTYAKRRILTVYPATYEVGLRDGDDWVALGDELDIEAVVVDHDDEPVAGQAVAARVVREGWHSWWEWSERASHDVPSDEGYRLRRDRRAQVVATCELTSEGETPVHCRHRPERPGTYLLEVTFRDEQGRETVASRRVYVAGPDEHPDRDPPGSSIEVTPTRRRWSVGETAELAFECPWDGAQALITVEREGVIQRERREVGAGGQTIEVPITAEMVPNVFVGVTLTRPRTAEPGEAIDLGAPDLRFGVAELRVQPATSQLEVTLDVPVEEARSGEEVPISVRVTDAEGRPVQAEVALWAVDEGTLRLTDYQAPNPTSGFFRPRAVTLAWEDLRRQLVSRVEPPPMPMSGGDGRGESDRDLPPEGEAFDPTPLWMPHLETDVSGRASATLTLPHRETEYRILAVVLDQGIRWGRATAQLVATEPLVLRPALPMFVRAGDRFEAAVFVHNTTDGPLRARLRATIGDEEVEPREVELEPNGEVRLAQPVTAPDEGPLLLRFVAEGDEYTEQIEQSLRVLPAGRWVRSQAVGGAEPGQVVSLELPRGASRTGGRVTLTVASHPFLGFEGAVAALEDSWWGSAESLAATLLGMSAYAELGLEGRPGAMAPEELRARGERLVHRLLELQNYEGGFGMYRANQMSSPRLTAFVVHALNRAAAVGIDVPEAALTTARENLEDLARGSYFGDAYDRNSSDNLAFALRVLTDGGADQSERAGALYEQRERLTPYGLCQLAMALGDDPRADTLVARAVELVIADRDDERQDPRRLRWYDHSARLYGAVLEATSRSEVGRPHANEIARRLLAERTEGRRFPWGTTLETAHALSALAAYARLFRVPEAEGPIVTLDGRPLEPDGTSRDAAWFQLPFADLLGNARRLNVQSGDGGPVFFAIDGRWAVPLGEADREARGNLIALHRTFETPEGRPLEDGAEIPLGSMVRVRLFVHNESSNPTTIAIRDPLAGGFEAVDAGLDSTPRQSLEALFGMGPDDEVVDPRGHIAMRSLSSVAHRAFEPEAATFYLQRLRYGLNEFTYAVRATTVGEFLAPPAQLEAMYEPDFVARSAVARLRVVEP